MIVMLIWAVPALAATDTASYKKALQKCEKQYKDDKAGIKKCKAKLKKSKKAAQNKEKAKAKAVATEKKAKAKPDASDSKAKSSVSKTAKTESKQASRNTSSDAKNNHTSGSSKSASAVHKQLKRVNINSASSEEMAASLPGIGKIKAKAIVDYRKKNGKFENADDLLAIPGIGEKSLNRLKPYLKL